MFSKLFCNKSFGTFFFLKRNAVVLKVASEKNICCLFESHCGGLEVMMARDPHLANQGRALAQEKTVTSCWRKNICNSKEKSGSLFFEASLSLYIYAILLVYDIHIKDVKTTSANCVSRNSVVFVLLTRTDWDVRPEKRM